MTAQSLDLSVYACERLEPNKTKAIFTSRCHRCGGHLFSIIETAFMDGGVSLQVEVRPGQRLKVERNDVNCACGQYKAKP